MLGFVVVDDGIGADVGNGFAFLVDCSILGVDVSKVGAVVCVDVTVPSQGVVVVVDGDIRVLYDIRRSGAQIYNQIFRIWNCNISRC